MPKMPGGDDGEKKEETAESREEAKEQVFIIIIVIVIVIVIFVVNVIVFVIVIVIFVFLFFLCQERLRQQAIKDKEKERTQFYQKQREEAKVERTKIREKVLFISVYISFLSVSDQKLLTYFAHLFCFSFCSIFAFPPLAKLGIKSFISIL